VLAAWTVVVHSSPTGSVLARNAHFARIVRVERALVEALAVDRARARPACSVYATLARFAAVPAATHLVGMVGAGFLVRQHRPVERILVRLADFAVVRVVGDICRDGVVPDET
jgi:hypothetical protein